VASRHILLMSLNKIIFWFSIADLKALI